MKRSVVILACETVYEGLHGINDCIAIELEEDELQEAIAMAEEMSNEVIDSYSSAFDYFNDDDEYNDSGEDNYDEYDDRMSYYIYRQRDDSDLTFEEVEQMLNDYGFDIKTEPDFKQNFDVWD